MGFRARARARPDGSNSVSTRAISLQISLDPVDRSDEALVERDLRLPAEEVSRAPVGRAQSLDFAPLRTQSPGFLLDPQRDAHDLGNLPGQIADRDFPPRAEVD